MNKNQTPSIAETIVGRVQGRAGKLVYTTEPQAKGMPKHGAGKTEQSIGDVKVILKHARRVAEKSTHPK